MWYLPLILLEIEEKLKKETKYLATRIDQFSHAKSVY